MLNENRVVHSLWIGNVLSNLELLSIYSFIKQGHVFKLWLYEPISTALPSGVEIEDASQIIPREKIFFYEYGNSFGHGKGSYAGFSDIFRYKLLYEKGGWWVDMDVTCLKRFDFTTPYFFRNHHDLKVVGNVLKCPKGSELMKLCYEESIQSVNKYNTDWLKPVVILNRHIANQQLENFVYNNVGNEDKWLDTRRLIWGRANLSKHWYFIHWQNEEWRKNAVTKTDFYYRSTIAKLMAEHQLYQMPEIRLAQLVNSLRHSSYFRALENLFLADV